MLPKLKHVLDSRFILYIGLSVTSLLFTSVYHRVDRNVPVEGDIQRRSDWTLVQTSRALVDIMKDWTATRNSSRSARVSMVRRAADSLLEVASFDTQTINGLRNLASVLRHYRESVMSEKRRQNRNPTENDGMPEIDANRMAEIADSVGHLIAGAEEQRIKEGVTSSSQPVVKHLLLHQGNGALTAWQRFQNGISGRHLYDDNSFTVFELLNAMRTKNIIEVLEPPSSWNGSQYKMICKLADEGVTIFRPDRWSPTDEDVSADVFYFVYKERPLADVASFYLDRILGFRRSPPVVFARLNITADIEALVSNPDIVYSYDRTPLGDECITVNCRYYCGNMVPICGVRRLLDGSFTTLLPTTGLAQMGSVENPWKRTYSMFDHVAVWQDAETSVGYCDVVRSSWPFNITSKLLDLIDVHIFDFLTGNMDRHHLYWYEIFGNNSAFIHMDNAKGFVKARTDEISILAPLYQCCQIRSSTLKVLLDLATSPPGRRLGDRLQKALSEFDFNPSLGDEHLKALNRRVGIVLQQVEHCHKQNHEYRVVTDDGL